MSLYLIILILVIAVPFAFSFEKNLRLYKRWKYLLPAIAISMLFFIVWDIIFTHLGCWQFNPKYNSGIYFCKLPLEEYLFFLAIPYACAFSYYALQFHFPKYKTNQRVTTVITTILLIFSLVLAFTNMNRIYTFVNFIVLACIVSASYFIAREVLQYFYAIFPVLLIPFFIINGILTGTGIDQEVFSYNLSVYSGIHIFSMPMEDMFYCFSLLLAVIVLTEVLEKSNKKDVKL